MASATFTISCTTTTTPISASNSHHLHRPSKFSLNPNPPKHRRSKLSCVASSSKDQTPAPEKNISPDTTIDRRNVLLGLGGLYGAYNLSLSGGGALANPVPPPVIKECGTAIISGTSDPVPYSCCPPYSDTIVDYKLPKFSTLNVRPAAHDVDAEYLEKYKTAVQKMKDLPYDDPRNFYQQANVHCAYCNEAYKLADGVTSYQIHNSWLFFPFHRWYLYFHERILQSLINDPTFTLPYWNWDNPAGMFIPEIFDNPSSSLYDDGKRDTINTKDYVVDLSYSKNSADPDRKNDFRTVRNNLAIMYRQMMGTRSPSLFFGHALRATGYDNESGGGSIESGAHTAMHLWVGNRDQDHHEDMGNFYSAANDPLFYCHHGNVDRMWSIWKTLPGKRRRDCTDPDFLQSEFLFYDENKNLVKVNVQDSLDDSKLGYTYQPMPTPWEKFRPTSKKKAVLKSTQKTFPPASKILPTTLAHTITFTLMRPSDLARSKEEKEDKDEILSLTIKYDQTKYINFDVFLNEDNECKATELDRAEYVGSFSNLAHIHDDTNDKPVSYDLAITELLEDLGLESERCISVTLVPKCDGEFVTINKAEIAYITEC
ncbi:unnamed protein product [Cuscuta epithymum]|uniref:catechol oxidase n=1 Tax=Cuscuta epithymum TaxID=186058 RepID=A0AAV0F674_9ASTE|nr:unnamed protein product [Cuscuta epithymum]